MSVCVSESVRFFVCGRKPHPISMAHENFHSLRHELSKEYLPHVRGNGLHMIHKWCHGRQRECLRIQRECSIQQRKAMQSTIRLRVLPWAIEGTHALLHQVFGDGGDRDFLQDSEMDLLEGLGEVRDIAGH